MYVLLIHLFGLLAKTKNIKINATAKKLLKTSQVKAKSFENEIINLHTSR